MNRPGTRRRFALGGDTVLLLIPLSVYLGAAGALLYEVGAEPFLEIARWFDPVFFAYNLVLLLLAVLVVPGITFIYVHAMKQEKAKRLKREVPAALWDRCEEEICAHLDRFVRFRNYLGSMLVMMAVITLGASIILLLKPASGGTGVDFGKGANFLTLGPFLEAFPGEGYTGRLFVSLTAFQFGFLGAYVHFIGQLARSYFLLDLTPSTFIDSAVRMITASVLALVLSFTVFPPGHTGESVSFIPLVSFFFGFFPTRALLVIEKIATRVVRQVAATAYCSTPLSALPGMSYAHELRLGREGFDNLENLSHADAVDLAVRTGFGYSQLRAWIEGARLRGLLGADYDEFVTRSGLHGCHELGALLRERDADAALFAGASSRLTAKLNVLCRLLREPGAAS